MATEGTPSPTASAPAATATPGQVTAPPAQPGAPDEPAPHPAVPTDPVPTDPVTAAVPSDLLPPGQLCPPAGDTATRHQLADRAAACFRRWCEDDPVACSELVSTLTPTLWHTARAYRLDGATAEDVVQNAWLALARRRDQLRDPQAVLAWLLVTVRRDAARTAAAGRASVPDPEPLLASSPDPAPGPASTVVEDDRAHRLWRAVGRLSERCQRLLRVVAFSDRPDYASLSVDLGMPVGSIGPTRGRCLAKLREHLGDIEEWSA